MSGTIFTVKLKEHTLRLILIHPDGETFYRFSLSDADDVTFKRGEFKPFRMGSSLNMVDDMQRVKKWLRTESRDFILGTNEISNEDKVKLDDEFQKINFDDESYKHFIEYLFALSRPLREQITKEDGLTRARFITPDWLLSVNLTLGKNHYVQLTVNIIDRKGKLLNSFTDSMQRERYLKHLYPKGYDYVTKDFLRTLRLAVSATLFGVDSWTPNDFITAEKAWLDCEFDGEQQINLLRGLDHLLYGE